MPSPFLAVNLQDGGTPQVRRYVTGVASTQGVAFGVLETPAPGTTAALCQRVTKFLGHSTWIVCAGTSIYRTTDAGASYSTVFGPDADLNTNSCKSGPHLLYPNGVATLVIAARSSFANWKLFTSTDGVTWVKSSAFALHDPGNFAPYSVTEWRGSIYMFFGTGSHYTFIFNTSTMSSLIGSPALSQSNLAVCVYNDRLFGLSWEVTNSANRTLYEFVGGAWVGVDVSFMTGGPTPGADAKFALFVDPGTNLMVGIISLIVGAAGWRAFTWNSALTRVDIAGAINLQALFGPNVSGARVQEMVDRQDNPAATNPSIYLYLASSGTAGTTQTMYQWNGPAAFMTSIGSGGNTQHAIPYGVRNGGECFWTSGQRHIERISATPVIGGVRFGFKIYSPLPTVDAVSVRWMLAPAADEYPHTPYATLSNPSVGTLGAGNTQVDGLDGADNGATTFFVTWLAQTDGYSIGLFAKTTPQIFS
jgi:hypothetical protein